MKNIKYLMLALSIVLLSACGGPSYDGEYVSRKKPNQLVNIKSKLVLGDESYIESFGVKQFCDSITERDVDDKTFLTCAIAGQQLPIEVIDQDTVAVTGLGKLYRVK